MGSFGEGVLCWYCGRNQAAYIPDGCGGAVCFVDDVANSCGDLFIEHGYQLSLHIRYRRLWGSRVRVLARALENGAIGSVPTGLEIELIIASFLFRE